MGAYAVLIAGVAVLLLINASALLFFHLGRRMPNASGEGSGTIRALVFDWGGVISTEGYWDWLKEHIPDIEDRREYFQNLIDRENRGAGTQEDLIAALAREAGQTEEEVQREMKDNRRLDADVVALIRPLKDRYKIGLLSNASSYLRAVIAEHNAWDLFDEVLISSEHKMLKPEPQIYATMASMLGVAPGEAVMIDDRKKNISGAQAAGMKGIVFTGAPALIAELKRLGVS